MIRLLSIVVLMAAMHGSSAAEDCLVYFEDFSNGPAGWVPIDLTVQESYWQQTTSADGRGVMWCGTDDPGYATSPGYGNNWDQRLSKGFTLPSTGSLALEYVIQFDTEPGYDSVSVEISTDPANGFELLDQVDGDSGGFQTRSVGLAAYAGQNVTIRFRFQSDGGWSDEDGLWDSDGACRLDRVSVTGYPDDEFESGSDGWLAEPIPPTGGEFRLVEFPSCEDPQLTCTPEEWSLTHSWVAYDENGDFPFLLEMDGSRPTGRALFGIESPPIPVDPTASDIELSFSTYRNLPIFNWVVFDWEIGSEVAPDVWQFNRWPFLGYGEWGENVFTESIKEMIPSGTSRIKVRLLAYDAAGDFYYMPWTGQHTAAPFFDNVSVKSILGEVTIAGTVAAGNPASGLHGVTVNLYSQQDGDLVATTATDSDGNYRFLGVPCSEDCAPISYIVSIVTPLGYASVAGDEVILTPTCSGTSTVDFDLAQLAIAFEPRSVGYWKHQIVSACDGSGSAKGALKVADKNGSGGCDSSEICDYLEIIDAHFYSNQVNQVGVYVKPASGLCAEMLPAAGELINLTGQQTMEARAKQQLMGLLLNAAAQNLSLMEVVSDDGATTSQAITFCDNLLDDPFSDDADYEVAKDVADAINNGQMVPAGVIPLDTANIAYKLPAVDPAGLENHPNPFNPQTTIHFDLPESMSYTLSIYNSAGRLVEELQGIGQAGVNQVIWNARAGSLASGIYVCQLQAGDITESRRMVLLK